MLEHFALSLEDDLLLCCRLGLALCVWASVREHRGACADAVLEECVVQFLEGEFPRKP